MGSIVEERRIGEFRIPEKYIREHPERTKLFLSRFLIIRAVKFKEHSILYTAYSESFDPVPEGEKPVYYKTFLTETTADGRQPFAEWLKKLVGE